MILEIASTITICNLPLIIHFSRLDFRLHSILSHDIKYLANDQDLRDTKRSQGEAVPQLVRRFAVNLSCNNASRVAHALLEANFGRSSVVWRHIDVQPSEIQARSDVDSDCTKKCREILDSCCCVLVSILALNDFLTK